MIERKLSKTQKRIFIALSQQKQRLNEQFAEIVEAEQEQIEMLRQRYDLPEGEYQLRQEQNGDLVLFAVPETEEGDDGESD